MTPPLHNLIVTFVSSNHPWLLLTLTYVRSERDPFPITRGVTEGSHRLGTHRQRDPDMDV